MTDHVPWAIEPLLVPGSVFPSLNILDLFLAPDHRYVQGFRASQALLMTI